MIRQALAASVGMLRERSVVSLGLGAAVVLSLLSVCCGVGLLTTPWFMCELYAVQIALSAREPVVRGVPSVIAALILLGAVLMVTAVAAITLLAASPELSFSVLGREDLDAVLLQRGALTALIGSAMALLLATPWLYAPLLLIEQRTRFDLALVESVRLVVVQGALRSVRLSLCAHALQASPLLLAAGLAFCFDANQVVVFVLAATPLLCVSVPLGQGMLVAAYVAQRERLQPAKAVEPRSPRTKPSSKAERCARAWTLLMVLPILSLLLLELSLLRPSRVPAGAAPSGEPVAQLLPTEGTLQRAILPNTALEVVAGTHLARVVASDGGGVGDLPLTAAGPIERVSVLRVRDEFAIEIKQAGQLYTTLVDRAGVRLDDDLRARLLDRVTPLQLVIFLCALLATGIVSVPVLYGLGQARRSHRLPSAERPSVIDLAQQDAHSLRRARYLASWLLPLSLACLVLALRALLAS